MTLPLKAYCVLKRGPNAGLMLFLPAKGLIRTDGSHHSVFGGHPLKKSRRKANFSSPEMGQNPNLEAPQFNLHIDNEF